MRKFIIKALIFGLLVLLLHLFAAPYANGITDAYYLRFTTPQQSHMIIGTSKAAQGIRPEFLNKSLGLDQDNGFFNYAFTLKHSPYGEVYLNSIMRKLDPETKDGQFIVCVDAWNLSGDVEDPNDPELFEEGKGELGTTHNVTWNPNYEYLLENYPHGWLKLIWKHYAPSPSVHELHADGWLQIDQPMDRLSVTKRTKDKIAAYKKNVKTFAPSKLRREYLSKLIALLQNHGTVYLVRLPVITEIAAIEAEYMPDFDDVLRPIIQENQLPYFDMRALPDTFRYLDGNHLYYESGKSVSLLIADFIKKERE